MRWLVICLLLGLSGLGCGRCRSSGDCDPGERCDFDNGDCVVGCKSDSECAQTAFCNLEIGRCSPRQRPPLFPPEDAASPDVSTSSAADAAATD